MALRLSPDVVASARALGHVTAELEHNRSGAARVHCNCGYTSTYRRTDGDALEALAHHLAKVTAARVVNGVSASRVAG